MSFAIVILRGSTMVLELSALQDTVSKQYPTTATASLDILDPVTGVGIAGATGLALTYDATTSGAATIYRGALSSTVAIAPGVYTGRLTIAAGGATRVMMGTCTVRDG